MNVHALEAPCQHAGLSEEAIHKSFIARSFCNGSPLSSMPLARALCLGSAQNLPKNSCQKWQGRSSRLRINEGGADSNERGVIVPGSLRASLLLRCQDSDLDRCGLLGSAPDSLRRLGEVLFLRPVDVGHELLRIAIDQREPGRLNLDHHPMALPKRVHHVQEFQRYL